MDITIFNYTDRQKLTGLCRALHIPEDLTVRLAGYLTHLNLNAIDRWFAGLFSLDTGGESVKRIQELCKCENASDGGGGLKALTVYLMAALHTKERYAEMGIGEKIFVDTMKALCRFVKEHVESYGRYGFDRGFWIYRQLSARLFRLGTLEFEIYRFPDDTEPTGPIVPGENTLSVHIPSDAVMNREELDNSYRMAAAFFPRFFPDVKYRCFYCESWLLSPVLKEILKPGSRILLFQKDYKITSVFDGNDGFNWIFKREYDDYRLLPEDTLLMRGMKKILLAGGKTGSGEGYRTVPQKDAGL